MVRLTPKERQRIKRLDPVYRKRQSEMGKRYRDKNRTKPDFIVKQLFSTAKNRAKTLGVAFEITKDDLVFEEKCPVFREPFNLTAERTQDAFSPTLDRIDPLKGYIKGNVSIVSFRANTLKNNLSLEEVEQLIYYIDNKPNPLPRPPRYSKTKRDMLYQAMLRAFRNKLEFNLFADDFEIPDTCPVLNIPIKQQRGKLCDNSPTLDRFDVTKGYLPDNVCVISFKANRAKGNGTLEDFMKIRDYIKRFSNES